MGTTWWAIPAGATLGAFVYAVWPRNYGTVPSDIGRLVDVVLALVVAMVAWVIGGILK